MSIYKMAGLIIFSAFIVINVYAEDSADYKEPMTTPYMTTESGNKSTPSVSEDPSGSQSATGASQKTEVQKQIKAKSVCIGKDCRSKWPRLKCANYDGRPAGETGDEFCSRMNQTCVAVSLGGGQTFFDECSVAASSLHRCRCCWVE